jgi:hypothetical protein
LRFPIPQKEQHALIALIQRAGHPIQHLVYGQAQPLKINSIHHQVDVAASTSAAYVRLGPFIRQLNGYALDHEFLTVGHRYSSLLLGPANQFDAIVATTTEEVNRGAVVVHRPDGLSQPPESPRQVASRSDWRL